MTAAIIGNKSASAIVILEKKHVSFRAAQKVPSFLTGGFHGPFKKRLSTRDGIVSHLDLYHLPYNDYSKQHHHQARADHILSKRVLYKEHHIVPVQKIDHKSY